MDNLANEKIVSNFVLVIDHNGENKGNMFIKDALSLAKNNGLDLVQVSDSGKFPVCKLMNYGKFKYESSKKQHSSARDEIKEIRVGYTIGEHDLEHRKKKILEFLQDGYKVKFSLTMTGREKAMMDLANKKFVELLSLFTEVATYSKVSTSFGRDNKHRDATFLSTTLIPAKKK